MIRFIDRANEHPLAQVFIKYQRTVYNKVYPLVMKHIHELIGIEVPHESVLEQKTSGADTFSKETDAGVELSSNSIYEEIAESEKDYPKEITESENDDGDNAEDGSKPQCDNVSNFAEVTEEIKSDVNDAINKGESEMAKLSKEKASIMKRMESFDMDAMDELFEDSDENEETDSDNKTARSTSSSSSSLPYSSLTSGESTSSVEKINDDIGIKGLEIEALRRYLQVSL